MITKNAHFLWSFFVQVAWHDCTIVHFWLNVNVTGKVLRQNFNKIYTLDVMGQHDSLLGYECDCAKTSIRCLSKRNEDTMTSSKKLINHLFFSPWSDVWIGFPRPDPGPSKIMSSWDRIFSRLQGLYRWWNARGPARLSLRWIDWYFCLCRLRVTYFVYRELQDVN